MKMSNDTSSERLLRLQKLINEDETDFSFISKTQTVTLQSGTGKPPHC